MDTFDNFMAHKCSLEYISQGFTVDMGDGYTFATDGKSPVIRKLKLTFTGYRWYMNEDGSVDVETNKHINNVGAFRDFWLAHLTHKQFIYKHPTEGNLNVRFSQPVIIPELKYPGFSVVSDFNVELIQMV